MGDVEARYWERDEDGTVHCLLCPHGCRIKEGRAGICRVRGVQGGRLVALGYGLVSSAGMDPIEKKPLYHFHPGQMIFSVGGWGCNFACTFCQNWSISQALDAGSPQRAPEALVRAAQSAGSIGIAYTYNEPLIGIEFVADCARQAREAGLVNVLVTNGYVQPGPAADLLPLIDALNVDVKSMDDGFYRKECRGSLKPVLDFVSQAAKAGCHLEVTNLLIPGLNDSSEALTELADWLVTNVGKHVPLHLSAYRPQYKMSVRATSMGIMTRAHSVCRERLDYVYLGNVGGGADGHDTRCPGCQSLLIERSGYRTTVKGIRGGHCEQCGRKADVVGVE